MKKLSLKLEDLTVESFATAGTVGGGVAGHQEAGPGDAGMESAAVPCTAQCITVTGCNACDTYPSIGDPCTRWHCTVEQA